MALRLGLISPSDVMRDALATFLHARGFDVLPFETSSSFLASVHAAGVDCVVLDLHAASGHAQNSKHPMLRELETSLAPLSIVVLADSLEGNPPGVTPTSVLLKPIDPGVLIQAIRRASARAATAHT